MDFKVGMLSEIGSKHGENEDTVLSCPDLGLFILADGMGGYKGGGMASKYAAEVCYEYVRMAISEGFVATQAVSEAISAANFTINEQSARSPELIGMGTTLTSLCFLGGSVVLGHVGDSRGYLVRGDAIRQISEDHVSATKGKVTLSRAVGVASQVSSDILELPVYSDDIFILCSDGVSAAFEDQEIFRITKKYKNGDLNLAAKELIRSARLRGSDDDASVILIQLRH